MIQSGATAPSERRDVEVASLLPSAATSERGRDNAEFHSTDVPVAGVEHRVQFYEDDEFLSAAVAKFLGEGITLGDSLVVIATEAHRHAFRRQLESLGFDVGRACESGQLTLYDASEMLSRFMRNGEPDRKLFELEVGNVVGSLATALSGQRRLRAYGEMVDVLWKEGQRKAAIRLEELWNDLQSRHSFTLLCAYAMASFYKEPAALQAVCASHTHVAGHNGNGHNKVAAEPHATSLPPQYALRLAQEIARREEVEQAFA